jgi:polar amino acid transport system substrate-binding protein
VFVRKGSEFPFASVQDLYGKTVGIVRGYKIGDEFNQAVAGGRIKTEEVTEKEMNVKKLDNGRIDCAISPLETTLVMIHELGLADRIVPLPKSVMESKPLHLLFSKSGKNIADKADFVKRFNTVLDEMKKDGTSTRIYERL